MMIVNLKNMMIAKSIQLFLFVLLAFFSSVFSIDAENINPVELKKIATLQNEYLIILNLVTKDYQKIISNEEETEISHLTNNINNHLFTIYTDEAEKFLVVKVNLLPVIKKKILHLDWIGGFSAEYIFDRDTLRLIQRKLSQ